MYRWRVLVLGAGMERTCRLDTGDQSKWAMSRPLVPKREDRNGGPRPVFIPTHSTLGRLTSPLPPASGPDHDAMMWSLGEFKGASDGLAALELAHA